MRLTHKSPNLRDGRNSQNKIWWGKKLIVQINIQNVKNNLVDRDNILIFALRNGLKLSLQCVQIHSRKRRGYCIAALVRFATFQIPAFLYLFLSPLKVAKNA